MTKNDIFVIGTNVLRECLIESRMIFERTYIKSMNSENYADDMEEVNGKL